MTLERRTLIAISITLLVMAAILYVFNDMSVERSFSALESREVGAQTERVISAIQNDIDSLDSTAGDWSGWDDPYAYVWGGNPQFVENNLDNVSLANLRLNLVALIHLSGRLVYEKGIDWEN